MGGAVSDRYVYQGDDRDRLPTDTGQTARVRVLAIDEYRDRQRFMEQFTQARRMARGGAYSLALWLDMQEDPAAIAGHLEGIAAARAEGYQPVEI
jgi:hypothetical protein